MQALLDQGDVNRLMAQPSPHARAIIASKLALVIDRPQMSAGELELAQDIIRKLARDVEMVVRRAVSQNLRHSKHLPHDVVVLLADDVEAVALPILSDSLVLTDADLISILQRSLPTKQTAVACRANVSEDVSNALITYGNETAVVSLMNNKGAKINDNSMNHALDRFASSAAVKESMVMRDVLPLGIAERLAVMVTGKLQDYLIAHHELPANFVAEVMVQSHERSLVQISQGSTLEDIEQLVVKMHANKRLTPTLILTALCAGNLPFFEYAMAHMAEMPITKARMVIHESGSDSLNALCQKNGMPPTFFKFIRMALEVMEQLRLSGEDQDVRRFRARLIEQMLTRAEEVSRVDMDYLLDLINQLGT